MNDSMLNWILAILAILAAIGNIVAYLFARIELRGQRRETKALTKLTSDLEHRVHRLAVNLDQTMYRLTRTRDLVTGLMKVSYALRQLDRNVVDKLDLAVEREMAIPELQALVTVISDTELSESFSELITVLVNPNWPKMWNTQVVDRENSSSSAELVWKPTNLDMEALVEIERLVTYQNRLTKQIHKRILELLEEATQVERNMSI